MLIKILFTSRFPDCTKCIIKPGKKLKTSHYYYQIVYKSKETLYKLFNYIIYHKEMKNRNVNLVMNVL